MTKLEDIQIFALRMCCKNWDAGYQELLDLTTMPTLENRRLYLKLCSLYKIISISHPMFLLHSLVELLLFRPSLTNLMPVPTTISHHLYPVPSQYGTTSLTPHLQHTLLNHQSTHRTFFCNCFNCCNRVHTGISCTYSYCVYIRCIIIIIA